MKSKKGQSFIRAVKNFHSKKTCRNTTQVWTWWEILLQRTADWLWPNAAMPCSLVTKHGDDQWEALSFCCSTGCEDLMGVSKGLVQSPPPGFYQVTPSCMSSSSLGEELFINVRNIQHSSLSSEYSIDERPWTFFSFYSEADPSLAPQGRQLKKSKVQPLDLLEIAGKPRQRCVKTSDY